MNYLVVIELPTNVALRFTGKGISVVILGTLLIAAAAAWLFRVDRAGTPSGLPEGGSQSWQ